MTKKWCILPFYEESKLSTVYIDKAFFRDAISNNLTFVIQNVTFNDGYAVWIWVSQPFCLTQIQGQMNILMLEEERDGIACKLSICTQDQYFRH